MLFFGNKSRTSLWGSQNPLRTLYLLVILQVGLVNYARKWHLIYFAKDSFNSPTFSSIDSPFTTSVKSKLIKKEILNKKKIMVYHLHCNPDRRIPVPVLRNPKKLILGQ